MCFNILPIYVYQYCKYLSVHDNEREKKKLTNKINLKKEKYIFKMNNFVMNIFKKISTSSLIFVFRLKNKKYTFFCITA